MARCHCRVKRPGKSRIEFDRSRIEERRNIKGGFSSGMAQEEDYPSLPLVGQPIPKLPVQPAKLIRLELTQGWHSILSFVPLTADSVEWESGVGC